MHTVNKGSQACSLPDTTWKSAGNVLVDDLHDNVAASIPSVKLLVLVPRCSIRPCVVVGSCYQLQSLVYTLQ